MTQKFAAPPVVGGVPQMKGSNLGRAKAVSIDPLCRPTRYGAGDHITFGGNQATEHNAYAQSNGQLGDWWEYDIVFPANPAGQRWGLWAYTYKSLTDGICRISLNGVTQIDIDLYAAAANAGALSMLYCNRTPGDLNFVTTRPEKVTMRCEAIGKNAAASGYRFVFTGFQFFSLF